MEAARELEKIGISAEVIDIQSLIPFDLSHEIKESVKKTNRLVVIDEDVEGGGGEGEKVLGGGAVGGHGATISTMAILSMGIVAGVP